MFIQTVVYKKCPKPYLKCPVSRLVLHDNGPSHTGKSPHPGSTQLENSTPGNLLRRLDLLRLSFVCIKGSVTRWVAVWFIQNNENMARFAERREDFYRDAIHELLQGWRKRVTSNGAYMQGTSFKHSSEIALYFFGSFAYGK